MKNRTIIGIICMIAAVAITFAAGPLVNRMTSDTTAVLRLKENVNQGAQLTEDHLEEIKINTAALSPGLRRSSKSCPASGTTPPAPWPPSPSGSPPPPWTATSSG